MSKEMKIRKFRAYAYSPTPGSAMRVILATTTSETIRDDTIFELRDSRNNIYEAFRDEFKIDYEIKTK